MGTRSRVVGLLAAGYVLGLATLALADPLEIEPSAAESGKIQMTTGHFLRPSWKDETYRKLGEHFTSAQIVELGFACANAMGLHRFLHTLDLYGTGEPVIPYSPDQVDTAKPDEALLQETA